jgi:hypothetical protein
MLKTAERGHGLVHVFVRTRYFLIHYKSTSSPIHPAKCFEYICMPVTSSFHSKFLEDIPPIGS